VASYGTDKNGEQQPNTLGLNTLKYHFNVHLNHFSSGPTKLLHICI